MAKDLTPVPSPKGDGRPLAELNMLRELQSQTARELRSATWEELSALLPSVLDKAFKQEL